MSDHSRARHLFTSCLLATGGLAIFVAGGMAAWRGDWRVARVAIAGGLALLAAAYGVLTPFGRPMLVRIVAGGIAIATLWGAILAFRSAAPSSWMLGVLESLACLTALAVLFVSGDSGWSAQTTQYNADPGDRQKRTPCALYGDRRLLQVSNLKLERLHPELLGPSGLWKDLRTLLAGRFFDRSRATLQRFVQQADVQAAVVTSVWPLTVAVYSDQLDGVCILEFSDKIGIELVERYGLEVEGRLLGLLVYRDGPTQADLTPGVRAKGEPPAQVWPLLGDFLCSDVARVEALKKQIPESHWGRALELGRERVEAAPHGARSGLPFESDRPGMPASAPAADG